MARELPQDNSKDMVVHARNTSFAMLLVCAVVVVAALFNANGRIERALDELDIVIKMREIMISGMKGERSGADVAEIISPRSEDQKTADIFKGTFDGTILNEKSMRPRLRRPTGTNLQCDFALDLFQRAFRFQNHHVSTLTMINSNASQFEIRKRLPHIGKEQQSSIPFQNNLGDFRGFWDVIQSSVGYVVMSSPDIENTKLRVSGVSGFDAPSFEVLPLTQKADITPKTMEQKLNAPSRHLQSVRDLSRARIIFGIKGKKNLNEASPYHQFVDYLGDSYDQKSEALVELPCIFIWGTLSEAPMNIYVPTEISEHSFSWSAALLRQVDVENRNRTHNGLGTKPFVEEFRNLATVSAGLEGLPLNQLRDWLEIQTEKESDNIELLGISIPPALSKLIGVFIVLIVQIYSILHTRQAALRMNAAKIGDPGAFQPWLFLYSTWSAKMVVNLITLAPVFTAGVVLQLIYVDDPQVERAATAASEIGFLLAAFATFLAFQTKTALRRAAERHLS